MTPLGSVSLQSTRNTGNLEPSFEELAKTHPDAAEAARQFEAVFLKQLLSSVEKASSVSGGSDTQGAVVGSMVTGALSEQLSAGGGIGLSEVILRAMVSRLPDPISPSPIPPAEGSIPATKPNG